MKPYFFILLFALTLISCSSNDDEIDCSLVDIAPQIFFIEYIDNDGNNLLDNGIYLQEEVEVTVDGEIMGEVYSNSEGTFLIIYELNAVQRNESDYVIKLSSTETDVMQLEFSEKIGICGSHLYNVERALYNGEEMELENYFGNEKITIVKSK